MRQLNEMLKEPKLEPKEPVAKSHGCQSQSPKSQSKSLKAKEANDGHVVSQFPNDDHVVNQFQKKCEELMWQFFKQVATEIAKSLVVAVTKARKVIMHSRSAKAVTRISKTLHQAQDQEAHRHANQCQNVAQSRHQQCHQ